MAAGQTNYNNSHEARKHARRGINATRVISRARKKIVKKAVDKAVKVTEMSRRTIITLGAMGFSAVQGEITTRDINGFDHQLGEKGKGPILRPVLEYTRETKGQAALELSIDF